MKLYTDNTQTLVPEVSEETETSPALLESHLAALEERLREIASNDRARVAVFLETARTLLRLNRRPEAWRPGREAFDLSVADKDWEQAVQACETLFLTEEPLALAALGQGVWLAVTFPITPDLTVEMLRRVVEETPDDSDGAAVAAATAHYVADLRTKDQPRSALSRPRLLRHRNSPVSPPPHGAAYPPSGPA